MNCVYVLYSAFDLVSEEEEEEKKNLMASAMQPHPGFCTLPHQKLQCYDLAKNVDHFGWIYT